MAAKETTVDDFFGFMPCDLCIPHRVWITAVDTIKIPTVTSALNSNEILFSVECLTLES